MKLMVYSKPKNNKKYLHIRTGFTIVELLIVIVIIAILATISIIAYGNIQRKATAARAGYIAKEYEKVIKAYRSVEGTLPQTDEWAPVGGGKKVVCLGPPDDYPEDDTFAEGECATWRNSTMSGRVSHFIDHDINEKLRTIASSLPSSDYSVIQAPSLETTGIWGATYSDVAYRGFVYRTENNEDETSGYITYFLEGTQTCVSGETHHHSGLTECVINVGSDNNEEEPNWGFNGGEGEIAYDSWDD